jgi:MAF protein
MMPLLLASASPRRHALLALAGIEFQVRPVSAPEIPQPGEEPAEYVVRTSAAKARLAAAAAPPGSLVAGADTEVVLDGEIIGKPRDAAHAAELLRRLRGRAHTVLTGLTVVEAGPPGGGPALSDLVRSRVPMRAYSDAEIEAYVRSGNPLDKAGAYAIQYGPFQPVDLGAFEDCFANVMGLPVCRLLRLIEQLRPGLTPPGLRLGDCARYEPGACPIVPAIRPEPG